MTTLTLLTVLVLLTITTSTLCLQHYKHEAHTIMKRMAKEHRGFEGHDVARVHLVEGQGQQKRRLERRDVGAFGNAEDSEDIEDIKTLQLNFSTGSEIRLTLRPAGVVSSDTVVSLVTTTGRMVRKRDAEDCYFHGQVGDSSGEGSAAISHCDGLFGFANSPDYEYFFHPVEAGRSKRDASQDYDVHVLWRRSTRTSTDNSTDPLDYGHDFITSAIERKAVLARRSVEGDDTSRKLVIEMAMFSDQSYCTILHRLYPGREDDFLLTRLAGTQALYSDRTKVGYDVKIKLKLLEYWETNPEGYTFKQNFGQNLRSSCLYTTGKYNYDIHAINSGITAWLKGQIGLAYIGGVCKSNTKCFVIKSPDLNAFVGFAHELGHTLGFPHQSAARCPRDLLSIGGFMGGQGKRAQFNFSPCMKYMLDQNINNGKAQCLFEETAPTLTSARFNELPDVFPGQVRTPDGLCEILGGRGYRFGPHERPFGTSICKWFICQNEDESSPEFNRARKFTAPVGFPCGTTSFCEKDRSCKPWSTTKFADHIRIMQSFTPIPVWSEWSVEVSPCSRSCGTGVRTRRRKCQYRGFNITPKCPGMAVKPELCNTDQCPGEPKATDQLRQLRGDEVCSRFVENNIKLNLKGSAGYAPISRPLTVKDAGPNFEVVKSKSCLLKCERKPSTNRGDLDAVMPDGTLCTDSAKSNYDLQRFNIVQRCVKGFCIEFSDCPNALDIKDRCGICRGNGSRCVEFVFDKLRHVARKQRVSLTIIPAGATNIDVRLDRKRNPGTVIELWSNSDRNIIGDGGQYSRKTNHEGVEFAGATWSYYKQVSFLRSSGPIKESVVIKALTLLRPIRRISLKYAEMDVSA